MVDDSFIREVDEEMRQDRLQAFWSRFGKFIIGGAVLIVLAVAGYRGFEYYAQNRAAGFGDRLEEIAKLSDQGRHDEVIAGLGKFSKEAGGEYPALARLRLGEEYLKKGEAETALKVLDALISDSSASYEYRDLARLRAGQIAIDIQDYASIKARLEPLTGEDNAYRYLAAEVLGISAMKSGDDNDALKWLKMIVDEGKAGPGVTGRANGLVNILAGRGIGS